MQSNPQLLWIKDPSAATIEVGSGDFAGEVRIVDQISILADSVTKCVKECASPCEKNVWSIQFQDIDFGSCNDCGKSVGFIVRLKRNPDFDNESYLDYTARKPYVYDDPKVGTVTGVALATYFETLINDLKLENDQHDQFFVEVVRAGDTLTLTFPCTGLVTYEMFIHQIENSNLTSAEAPIITEVTPGVEAILSKERLLREFPQEVGHVFGEAPKDMFMWCDDICVIKLEGCIDACHPWTNQNSGHLHKSATPFTLYLYVNSKAPGFADFITALNAAFGPCTLDTLGGLNGDCVNAVASGGNIDLDMNNVEFDAAGASYTLQVGGVTLVTPATVVDLASLAAALLVLFPSGTFTPDAPSPGFLRVSGALAALGTSGSICLNAGYRLMSGE